MTSFNCSRCGGPMPVPTEEVRRLINTGQIDVSKARHDDCVDTATQVTRRFEARVQVFEVVDNPDAGITDASSPWAAPKKLDRLAEFTAHATAPSAGDAMRSNGELAEMVGRKWAEAASLVHLADVPVDFT